MTFGVIQEEDYVAEKAKCEEEKNVFHSPLSSIIKTP
jgi:hypothetical protein